MSLLELERSRTLGFAEEYKSALRSYLLDASAPHLQRAREIGPIAIVDGIGSLTIVNLHHEEMVRAFGDVATAEEIVRLSRRGATFLAETLAPLESTHQGLHEAIATIRSSEERYRNIIEMAGDVVCTLSPHGVVLSLNAAFSSLTGFRRDEHLGRSFVGLLHHEDMSRALQLFDAAMKGERPEAVDMRVRTALSGFFPFEFLFTPLQGGRQIDGVLAVGRPCARRKEAEQLSFLRASIAEHVNDAVLICSADGTIRAASNGAKDLLGWTEESQDESKVSAFATGSDADALERAIRDADAENVSTIDLSVRTKKGETMSVACSVSRSVDPSGQTSVIVKMRSEQSPDTQRPSTPDVDRNMERLGRLTSGIVHRLNDVFAALVLGIHSLSSQQQTGEAKPARSSIEKEVHRGAHLVKELMELSSPRPQEGATFSTGPMVDALHAIIGQTFPKNISVEFGVPLGLWDVRGDRSRIQQGLLDVCLSIRDRLPRGGTIVVTAENVHVDRSFAQMQAGSRPGPYVCFTVSDSHHTDNGLSIRTNPGIGDGIEKDPLNDEDNEHSLQDLAASQGGFSVSSTEPGKGTRQRLYVPAITERSETTIPESDAEESKVAGDGHVVLIVDDEPGIRDITRSALASYGYEVMTATDGADAVTTFADHAGKIEVVVTDLMMPYMGGSTAIRAMRQIDPNVRIIATSGAVPSSEVREMFNERSVMFLPKPYNASDLVRTINAVLVGTPDISTTHTRGSHATSNADER